MSFTETASGWFCDEIAGLWNGSINLIRRVGKWSSFQLPQLPPNWRAKPGKTVPEECPFCENFTFWDDPYLDGSRCRCCEFVIWRNELNRTGHIAMRIRQILLWREDEGNRGRRPPKDLMQGRGEYWIEAADEGTN